MYQVMIDAYSIMYSSNTFHPRISLLSEGKYVAQLIFMPNGQDLPEDAVFESEHRMFYHLENYQHIADMLGKGKPLQLIFNGSGGGNENCLHLVREDLTVN